MNVAVVQCFANVSNMVEQPAFKWSVQYKQSNSTWIHEDTGVLNIGPDEILDKDIVVWATCTVDGKAYQGSLALHLVSGTQEDTSITAVFNHQRAGRNQGPVQRLRHQFRDRCGMGD